MMRPALPALTLLIVVFIVIAGCALVSLGRCNEAKESYTKALGINPGNSPAQQGLQNVGNPAICKPKTGS